MLKHVCIKKMEDRVKVDRQDSDLAFFSSLLLQGELTTKLIVTILVASVLDERERHQYRLCYDLVRADGIGAWVTGMEEILVGPAAQFVIPEAKDFHNEIAQKVRSGSWQFKAISQLKQVLSDLDIQHNPISNKIALRQWYADFATLRNKTKGHGAKKLSEYSKVAELLEDSINIISNNLKLLSCDCVYLHQNLSGKYNVTTIAGETSSFKDFRKSDPKKRVENGVYIDFGGERRIDLLLSDRELTDFFLPNGSFRPKERENISYISGEILSSETAPYLTPITDLPESESQGLGELDLVGDCFTNVPNYPQQYILRHELELRLIAELNLLDRHPIITLSGPGGIGKTFLALKVVNDLIRKGESRFDFVVWFSARDIDLLAEGPKVVRPHVTKISEFAKEYVSLTEPHEQALQGFDSENYFASKLSSTDGGKHLFIFDNFETVKNPAEIMEWIDTYIRSPNKALITTRKRDFVGDVPIQVNGMDEEEASELIDNYASRFNITSLIDDSYKHEVFQESDGHPYIIKVLLGQLGREKRRRKVERIIASNDKVLLALFERTFNMISEGARRVFLTLCNWKSTVPAIALEAVILRSTNEKFSFQEAVDELLLSSLIEEETSSEDNIVYRVPLSALLFGKQKIETSPWKPKVVADSKLLQLLGGSKNSDERDVAKRIERLFRQVASRFEDEKTRDDDLLGVLEFIARSHPPGWLLLRDIHAETTLQLKDAIRCSMSFLENPAPEFNLQTIWKQHAALCQRNGDALGQVHALVSITKCDDVPTHRISSIANQINSVMNDLLNIDREELLIMLQDIITEFESRSDKNADDLSRLSWLYRHVGERDKAKEAANSGLSLDSGNMYCQRILSGY